MTLHLVLGTQPLAELATGVAIHSCVGFANRT